MDVIYAERECRTPVNRATLQAKVLAPHQEIDELAPISKLQFKIKCLKM